MVLKLGHTLGLPGKMPKQTMMPVPTQIGLGEVWAPSIPKLLG